MKLKLTDIVQPLRFKTHEVNLFWSMKDISKRQLDFDVYLPTKGINLQRPLVWTTLQKQQLILSVIKRMHIPKLCILVNQNGDSGKAGIDEYVYEIIDGKQRLNAIMSFFNGEFPLTHNGADYFYADLEEAAQREISTFSPRCEVSYFVGDEITDDDKIQWFGQINFAGTPQDVEHMNNLLKK